MSRKSDIVASLVLELQNITPNVFSTFKYIDEINDFPTICLIVGSEGRQSIGGGIRYGNLSISIRGYVFDSSADNLLEDIETNINTLSDCINKLEDAKILTLTTDEGLFDPYGIVDITALLTYEVT